MIGLKSGGDRDIRRVQSFFLLRRCRRHCRHGGEEEGIEQILDCVSSLTFGDDL